MSSVSVAGAAPARRRASASFWHAAWYRYRRNRLALVAGPAVFLVTGLAGELTAGSFFAYPPGIAKPIILSIEAFMLLSIAAALPMLVAGPPSERPER